MRIFNGGIVYAIGDIDDCISLIDIMCEEQPNHGRYTIIPTSPVELNGIPIYKD